MPESDQPPLPMTASRLARELGVGKIQMWKLMQDLRIYGLRISSRLNPKQEAAIRTHFSNVSRADKRLAEQLQLARQNNWASRAAHTPPQVLATFPHICLCCDRRWSFEAEGDQRRPHCPTCEEHAPEIDETSERKVQRAEAHVELFKEARQHAHEFAEEAHRLRDAAYESRRKWQKALAEVMLDHEVELGTVCWCGQTTPCRTWRVLAEANPGIQRAVEGWASLSDKELEAEFAPRNSPPVAHHPRRSAA